MVFTLQILNVGEKVRVIDPFGYVSRTDSNRSASVTQMVDTSTILTYPLSICQHLWPTPSN